MLTGHGLSGAGTRMIYGSEVIDKALAPGSQPRQQSDAWRRRTSGRNAVVLECVLCAKATSKNALNPASQNDAVRQEECVRLQLSQDRT